MPRTTLNASSKWERVYSSWSPGPLLNRRVCPWGPREGLRQSWPCDSLPLSPIKEEFFDEVRDIYRDSQAILRILPVSELTWVCSDVDLGDIPSVLICMRHRALWERAWTQFIFIIIVQIYTVLIDKLGGTGKKPCCTGEWRPPVWSLNTFWPRSSKKDGSMRRAEMIKAIWWKWRSIRWIFSISKIVS